MLDVNPAFTALFGYTREEARQATTRLIHVDDDHAARFMSFVEEHMRRGGRAAVEWPFRRKDGARILCHIAFNVVASHGERGSFETLAILRDVTRQKEAETRLRLHSQVLDSMVEGVSLTTAEGIIVYTNPAEDAMFGYDRGELVGKHVTVQNAYAPEENARVVGAIIARLEERGYWEGEFENVRKDGSLFATHARITALEMDGAPHWVCVQEDITQRRKLEARERDNTRALQTLVRVQEDMSRTLDVERVVQTVTDAATIVSGAQFGAFFYNVIDAKGERYTLYALSGVPREAFAGFPHPRNTPVFQPTFEGLRTVRSDDITKDPRYGKLPPHHGMPEGHLPVRSYLAVPVVSRDGTVHGGLFFGHAEPGRFTPEGETLVSAVAGQAAIALDNANLYRRARESEERWRSLVDNAPVHIMTVDAGGRLRSLNRAPAGVEPASLLGREVYGSLVPEERERVRTIIARVLETGEPAEFEARGMLPDDQECWSLVRAAPLTVHGEKGAVLISADITQRKRGEAELAEMRAQLIQGEKLAALGSLVSGVAHELRTPLTFLSNNAFLMQQRLARAATRGASAQEALDDASRFLTEITAAVDRINQLVEDLRRYTKTRQDPQLTVASLHSMIADAVELFRATNRTRHPIETSLSATRPVRGNKGALQQLVLNLMQNAADATPRGLPLRIVTRDGQEGAILEVIDRGAGIPREVVDRMFEPLFTTKEEGTGLGLSIVKRIVEEHNATIAVATAPGEGTRFTVAFPLA